MRESSGPPWASAVESPRDRAFSRGAFNFAKGSALGTFSRCSGNCFCRKRRNEKAVGNSFGAARSGSRPLESTCSSSTGILPAAATMRGRKKQGTRPSQPRRLATPERPANPCLRPPPFPGTDSRTPSFLAANVVFAPIPSVTKLRIRSLCQGKSQRNASRITRGLHSRTAPFHRAIQGEIPPHPSPRSSSRGRNPHRPGPELH